MKTNQWLRPFLFTLVVIVAPIITYYIYSVESRETFLLERFHAHLANSAGRIEGRFSSAFDVMRHNRRGNEELGLAIEPDDCGDPQDTKGGQEAAEIKSVSRTSERALALTYWDCAATANTIALVGQVDVERQFDEVVILDDKNAVVFQRDPEDGRIASGQLLVERADSDSESKSAISDPFADMRVSYQGQTFLVFSQPLVVSDETGAPGVTAPPNQPGAPSNGTSKASADSEPETNSSSKASAAAARPVPASWQIVGLVEEGQFNSLKYSVSTSNLALVALLVLTALFGGPFLKLWYLGRFEPLTRFDILFMIGGGLCLVATGTVTLLAWDTSTLVSGYLDSRLETVSKALRVAIDKEFDEAVDALHALEPAMVAAYTQRNVEAGTSTI
jgi:hypothetical protein